MHLNLRTAYRSLLLILPLLCTGNACLAQTTDENPEDLILPEGMQPHEIDSLLSDWQTRHFLFFDDNCQSTGENPQYDAATYAQRLSRLPNVVPMPYNDIVQKYIDQYSNRLRHSVAVMLGANNFYTPIFEEALESYQLPLELRYLPIIESALNPTAVSRAGAVGLWQFMIGTGKQYGLEVTSLIDERRDPIKASYAAAHYLHDLYSIFGDWTLVIASYNCGPGNITKAIKRAGGVTDYWAICPYLPAETRGYVPAFIAANYIMNYYCEHNICPINTKLPPCTDTIQVNRNVNIERIAELCDITADELRTLNPQYRTSLIPGAANPCTLRMPPAAINAFIEAGDSIFAPKAEVPVAEVPAAALPATKNTGNGNTITVRQGDTLGSLAKHHHTTVEKLQRLNGMKNTNLRAGQKLKIR